MNLSLHRKGRHPNTPKLNTVALSTSRPSASGLQNEAQAGASESTATATTPAGFPLSPQMMAPFAGMLPSALRFPPVLDVGAALLRLPGLARLAQVKHPGK